MPKKIPSGAIIFARISRKSKIWENHPAWWFKVWAFILMKVNHKDTKEFKRGTGFFTRDMIYEQCCLHNDRIKYKSIDNVIRWLRTNRKVTTQKTTRGMTISVCNYDYYQDLDNYIDDSANDLKTTQKRHRNDTIDKNVKNVKNVTTYKKNVDIENEEYISAYKRSTTLVQHPDEQGAGPPNDSTFLEIPLKAKSDNGSPLMFPIYQSKVQEFQELYPEMDVKQALRGCLSWNKNNPGGRKTKSGILKHVAGWLERAQNKGEHRKDGSTPRKKFETWDEKMAREDPANRIATYDKDGRRVT